jgi:hypothetical protein
MGWGAGRGAGKGGRGAGKGGGMQQRIYTARVFTRAILGCDDDTGMPDRE